MPRASLALSKQQLLLQQARPRDLGKSLYLSGPQSPHLQHRGLALPWHEEGVEKEFARQRTRNES